MKCPACGKQVDEGFAYCPWCGNKTATTEEQVGVEQLLAKQLAVQEKLKRLRNEEIGWSVAMGVSLTISVLSLAFAFHIIITVSFLVAFISSIFALRQATKQRQDLVKKLEQGKFE